VRAPTRVPATVKGTLPGSSRISSETPLRGPLRRFSESPSRRAWRKVPETLRQGLPRDPPETLPRHPSLDPLSSVFGVPLGGMLPRGAPALQPFPGSLSWGERWQREEELDKEFAERVCLHEEEATAEFPLRLSTRHLLEHVNLDCSICSRMVLLISTPSSGYNRSTRQLSSTSSSTSLIRKKRTTSSTALLVRGWRGTATPSRRTLWMETTISSLKSNSFAWRR
jgi:hypothetical protein